jgi:hypothetical protein
MTMFVYIYTHKVSNYVKGIAQAFYIARIWVVGFYKRGFETIFFTLRQ